MVNDHDIPTDREDGPTPRNVGLDRTFAALSDPTRRALLTQLSARPGLSVSELARPFAMSLPSVMKHLDVLSDAGLISRRKTGRTVACRLTPGAIQEAMGWLSRHEEPWTSNEAPRATFGEEREQP